MCAVRAGPALCVLSPCCVCCAASPQPGVRHTALLCLAECIGDADELQEVAASSLKPQVCGVAREAISVREERAVLK